MEIGGLSAGAGLMLWYQEIARARPCPIEIIGVLFTSQFMVFLKKGIYVITQEVQVFRESPAIINVAENPIVCRKPFRLGFPEQFNLFMLEDCCNVTDVSEIIQFRCRVAVCGLIAFRSFYFIE